MTTNINPIKTYGSEILRTACQPVQFPNPELTRTIQAMFLVMYRLSGVGLAANQIGIPEQLAVINVDPEVKESEQVILINPKILGHSQEQTEGDEGCLSIPEIWAPLKRWNKITVLNTDLEGKQYEFEADGLLAVAVQHEIDHLQGKLFVDHVEPIHKILFENKLKKMARATRNSAKYSN